MHANTQCRKLPTVGLTRSFAACFVLLMGPAASVEVGDAPPEYLGKTSSGQELFLSDSAGRIRIVSFWASWCSPCLKELPVLNAIQKKGGSERIQVVAINLKELPVQFRRAMRAFKDYQIEFVHDRRGSIARTFGVEGIPHMLIVDVDGRTAYRHIGYNEGALDRIVAQVNALLVKNEMT